MAAKQSSIFDIDEVLKHRESSALTLIQADAILRVSGYEIPEYEIPKIKKGSSPDQPVILPPPQHFEEGPTLTSLMREACEKMVSDITKHRVADYIKLNHPDFSMNEPTIGSSLGKLEKRGFLEIVSRGGAGGNPSIYRLARS